MRIAVLPVLVSAILAGCADRAAIGTSAASPLNGIYDCTRAGQAERGAAAHRIVMLRVDPASKRLVLDIVDGHDQVLDPVQGTSGQLFANQSFAWRIGSGSGTLTDVERIATYVCQRAGDLPPAGGAGGT